jgi:hypothetical protein
MSAWIVSKTHIDVMVCGIVDGTSDGVLEPQDRRIKLPDLHAGVGLCDKDVLGQMLVNECVASVSYRYPNDKPGELPGPNDQYYLQPYRFTGNYRPTAAELAKAISCYDYQSCEHPGWKPSTVCKLLEVVQQIVGVTEGTDEYEAAAWGFEAKDLPNNFSPAQGESA